MPTRVSRHVVVCLVLISGLPIAHAASWSVGAGAFESRLLPRGEHLGFYGMVGAAAVIPLGRLILSPGLALEASPDTKRWGAVGSLTLDFPLNARVGLDLGAALVTDQAGSDFGHLLILAGISPGLSFYFGSLTISPFVSVFRAVNEPGWAVAPGLFASRGL